MNIRERILARRDLDAMRTARDITGLADALNAECQPALVPARINAASILSVGIHQEVITEFIQAAADGANVAERAQQLLSEEGVEVMEPGFVPALTNQFEVSEAMYYPDGTEK